MFSGRFVAMDTRGPGLIACCLLRVFACWINCVGWCMVMGAVGGVLGALASIRWR